MKAAGVLEARLRELGVTSIAFDTIVGTNEWLVRVVSQYGRLKQAGPLEETIEAVLGQVAARRARRGGGT